MKRLLFIIDMQNDFCLPSGSLFVPGAEEDVKNVSHFIKNNQIDSIILTADSHQVMDIAHPSFWKNVNGGNPSPYTTITAEDVESGKWIPFIDRSYVIQYLYNLEKTGEYSHTIWPEHCIQGSEGAAIHSKIMDAVSSWSRKGHYFQMIEKGKNPLTEFFGAFRANVPIENDPETEFDYLLKDKLKEFDIIYIAGEAKTHCVANTIKQLFDFPEIMSKMVILEDCMSNIQGFETIAEPIYQRAEELGAKIKRTIEI